MLLATTQLPFFSPSERVLFLSVFFPASAIFQNYFNCMLENMADHIAAEQCFPLDFEDTGVYRFISKRFWRKSKLCRVLVCRSSVLSIVLTGELGSLARLLSAVSTKADIVVSTGCPLDLLSSVDYSDYINREVQSCFRFERLDLSKLKHKPNYRELGRKTSFLC